MRAVIAVAWLLAAGVVVGEDKAPTPAEAAAGVDYAALLKAAAAEVRADPALVISLLPDGSLQVAAVAQTLRELAQPSSWKLHWDRTWARYVTAGAVAAGWGLWHASWNNGWGWRKDAADDNYWTGRREPLEVAAEEEAERTAPTIEVHGNNAPVVIVTGDNNDTKQETAEGE